MTVGPEPRREPVGQVVVTIKNRGITAERPHTGMDSNHTTPLWRRRHPQGTDV
jgi:hypothetical protein